jgi:hypothetical protein
MLLVIYLQNETPWADENISKDYDTSTFWAHLSKYGITKPSFVVRNMDNFYS